VLLRSNERSIDLSNFTIDSTNTMVKGTLNDAWVRTEHYLRQSETEFYQLGGSWDQDLGDRFRFTLMGGFSQSDADIPVETTFVFDDRDAQNYQFDYTNRNHPLLTFGTSVETESNFQLAEIRDRPSNVTNKFRTAQLRGEWDVMDDATIKAGALYRRFSFDSVAYTRDAVVCGNGGLDIVLRQITCSPSSLFGPTAIYGFPATGLSESVSLGNAGQPSGTTTSWLIPNIDKSAAYTGLYGRTPVLDAGNNRSVIEEVTGGYMEFDVKGDILGLDYAMNAGLRYVHTDQSSSGLNSGTLVTVERTYDDWLPSMNLVLYPAEDLIIRGAIGKVMTRPTLGNLTPGGSVDGFNYRVTYGNPFLDPFRAMAYDLALEWYFAPQALASVAVFKKDVESFPVSAVRSGTFASTGLPLSVLPPSSPAFINPEGQLWTITGNVNGTGASLKGVELSLQAPFTFLPGFLSNFGGIVNATFVDSSAVYTVAGPSVTACVPPANPATACAFGPNVSATRTSTLFGLSETAYNAVLYYEDDRFSARVSGSYRGPYVDANSGTGNVFEGYNSAINFDASVRYKITEWVEISLEGLNLTDDYRDRYTDLDANRNYEYNHFGRTFLAGARFKL
jgi:TonB-dependent receptor